MEKLWYKIKCWNPVYLRRMVLDLRKTLKEVDQERYDWLVRFVKLSEKGGKKDLRLKEEALIGGMRFEALKEWDQI